MEAGISLGAVGEETLPAPAASTEPVLSRRNLVVAAALFLGALLSLFVLQRIFHIASVGVSNAPHYLYQAEGLLRGRWDIALPPTFTDVVLIHGKDYIVYPPFPALLLLPLVAIFGLATSDVLFTAIVSACGLPLLFLLFEQARRNGLTRRSWVENLIFAAFCYYGSINLWLSLGGRMWFTAQVVCFVFTLAALLVGLRGHYAWSAVLLGCAFFSRATVLFAYPFLFYLAWQGTDRGFERFARSLVARAPDWSTIPWRRLAPITAVTVGVVLLFFIHNTLIFGSPLNTGYDILIQQHYPSVTTGAFNIRYIPSNLVSNFFDFPKVTFTGPFDRHPTIDMLNGAEGLSVFFTTPLFLLLFWRNRVFNMTRAALWVTLGLTVVVLLLFHAAGWITFGARYLYDAYPLAFLLLALNEEQMDWRFVALGLLGVGINLLGAHQFWTDHIVHL